MNQDGSLTNFRLFAENGGEGVAVDSRGNVYVAAGQIYVYDPAGSRIATIESPSGPCSWFLVGPTAGHSSFLLGPRSIQCGHVILRVRSMAQA